MHRTDAALLALALCGVLFLAGLARWSEPDVLPIAEASRREGARVAVEGLVLRFAPGPRAALVSLAQEGARLDGFADADAPIARGDLVRAVGVVSRGDSTMMLSIERAEVLVPAATRALDVATLARRAADHDGARVLVYGEAEKVALGGGGARIATTGEPAPAPGWWLAEGDFRYDERRASYILDVDGWRRPG